MDHTYRGIPLQSFAVIALAAACLQLPMRGQAAVSPATQPARMNGLSSNSQQDASQITTIRTYSNLVVIDVVVNDSQGNPIHGLKASDFTLTENNKSQAVRHFEEHSEVPASDIQIAPAPKLPAGLFTNKSPAPANGPVNVLLLDYLNTPLSSQPYARRQLLDYLDHAAPTRLTAGRSATPRFRTPSQPIPPRSQGCSPRRIWIPSTGSRRWRRRFSRI